MEEWHIITGEYPPAPGGVSDYTYQIAQGLLSAGENVHVWVPRSSQYHRAASDGISIHELDSRFTLRDLRCIKRYLDASDRKIRLLIQYVPHAFGFKALNIPFCGWLWFHKSRVPWIMFHEVAYPIRRGQPLKHNLLGVGTRVMATLASRAASRIMVSTSAWEPMLNRKCESLPVPSNVPYDPNEIKTAEIRKQYATRGRLLGHFGSFGALIRDLLTDAMLLVLKAIPDVDVLLMGFGSDAFAQHFRFNHKTHGARVHSIGTLPNTMLSKYISACDVMLQPFPDGVTTRRGTVMAALSHGRATVTNAGDLTESIWKETQAVSLCSDSSASALAEATCLLLSDESARRSLGNRALGLYTAKFDISRTLNALLSKT